MKLCRNPWILFLLFLIAPFVQSSAENPVQDSLRTVAYAHPNDTIGIQSLTQLARSYFATHLDSALSIGRLALERAKTIQDDESMAQCENTLGIARLYEGNNREAMHHFKAVFDIRERLGDKTLLARAANNLALACSELGEYGLALDYHLQSLTLKEELADSSGILVSNNNIGLIYESLQDYPTARSYYQKALSIFPLERDSTTYATNLYNIGVSFFKEEQNDSAQYCFQQSFPLVRALGDHRMIGLHHLHFGVIEQRNNNYGIAEAQIQKSIDIFQELGKKDQLAASMAYLGLNQLAAGQENKALVNCQKGLDLAIETENVEKRVMCLECIHRSYGALGRTDKAYAAAMEFYSLRDSLSSEETHKQIVRRDLDNSYQKAQLADSLETARTTALLELDYKNDLGKQESLTFFMIVIGALLLGLAILLLFNLRNRKRRSKILEVKVAARTMALEKQKDQLAEYAFINAHLLRQPLTQILGLIPLIQMASTTVERDTYLELLSRSSNRLDEVIHQIRDVVEEENGNALDKPSEVELVVRENLVNRT